MPHQMPDSPDQMIYTLQQENKNLKKILKEKEKKLQQKGRELQQKGRALEQKDRELDLERSLWKSRDGDWDASKGAVLHRLEVLDDIVRDADKLRQSTLADGPKFRYMLERAGRFLAHSGQMPLFRDDDGIWATGRMFMALTIPSAGPGDGRETRGAERIHARAAR